MKFRVFIVFVFFICILLPGNNLAHNKVVVIPLIDDDDGIQTVTSAGRVWMDRNLGAHRVAQSVDDYQAYGWMYQWGRLADRHETRHSPILPAQSSGDVPPHGSFITVVSYPYDWRYTQNDNLWQPGTGVNNPCPAGFRVPTETEWETEIDSWNPNNSAGAFASPLKLVVAGSRNRSNGEIFSVGSYGFYWSSAFIGSDARSLYLSNSDAYMDSNYRAYGFSVRCIKN